MLNSFLEGLVAAVVFALLGWVVSVWRRDTSIVDTMWSLLFLIAGYVYFSGGSNRSLVGMILLSIWAIRLSGYITWRNWGEGEDRRYKQIRENNDPGFWYKSLYIVFGFQALLACIIASPLYFALGGSEGLFLLEALGYLLISVGLFFEAGADFQLAAFKAVPENKGKVMDKGLWGYSRHPNYFGNFCIWWGFYILALAAGGWWTIYSPLMMSFLLLKVSGVALLEKDIKERKPKYADYCERVNAFFPWMPKR